MFKLDNITEIHKQPKTFFSKKIIISLIIISILLCSVGWYFLYFIKTPAYSLDIIRNSIEKHDVVTLKKHVDIDNYCLVVMTT